MFKVNDIVVITTDSPSGVDINVNGHVGIIMEIYESKSSKEISYCVKETPWGYEFYYGATELRYATEKETREKVKELILGSED